MRVLRSALALGLLAVVARPAHSQDRYATAEVRGGYSVTNGSTKDLLKGQTSFGGAVAIALGSKAHLGLTADWAHHSERFEAAGTPLVVTTPLKECSAGKTCTVLRGVNDRQVNIIHAFLKFSYTLFENDKVGFDLNAGPGIMSFAPNRVLRDATGESSDVHFALNGGASITYWFTDRIGLVASPQVDVALKKTSGTFFTQKSAVIFPMTGGFRFKL